MVMLKTGDLQQWKKKNPYRRKPSCIFVLADCQPMIPTVLWGWDRIGMDRLLKTRQALS